MKKIIYLFLLFTIIGKAQNLYSVDISEATPQILSGHLKQGTHVAPNGDKLELNSLYFIKNGKPWYPVMGELHYSRIPKSQWEESILKMKAAGIDVIATYVFWIYHEEEQGKWNWEGDNDLKAFVSLCKKHHIFVFPRIGPWCHGEVRNGGFPDWIIAKGNTRSDNADYLSNVQKFYHQIATQLKGLYFKDGGPIIGVQIENEFRFNNPKGLAHILGLKKMAVQEGIDVPFYTATGWPGSDLKQVELVPVWGAYPEAPWDKKTIKLPLSNNYLFGALRNDAAIGSDLFGKQDDIKDYKGYRYPYATAEMGGGNQGTYHRRPIITSDDVTALAYTKIGSGANLMGYYMFHGGSNKIGKLSTLQESKATKYPNDYPIINYDFQSPIGEFGILKPSFYNFRILHTFLNEFGNDLVTYTSYFPNHVPKDEADKETLRFAVRAKENKGFVFVSQVQRQLEMSSVKNVQFQLKVNEEKNILFPENPINIEANTQAIFPFNMDLEGINLAYSTAQPLYKIEGKETLYVFFEVEGATPEFVFDKENITKVTFSNVVLEEKPNTYKFTNLHSGLNCIISFVTSKGKKVNVLTISKEQAKNAYKIAGEKNQKLIVANKELLIANNEIKISGNKKVDFYIYPKQSTLKSEANLREISNESELFKSYSMDLQGAEKDLALKEITDITPYLNKHNAYPVDERLVSVDGSNPGIQYQTNLTAVEGAKYYLLSLSEIKKYKEQSFNMILDYYGDTGAIYVDGKLMADNLYDGNLWKVGFNQTENKLDDKTVLLQIVPLTDERQIYFEPGIREVISGKESAGLKSGKISFSETITFTIK
ncbi:beta-galactosidase [Flavobacterium eburneipallidum]|uniref:beta-galactosidase n=1 Tax=Flavobacterium eburneipallidum TaxID=3003263 RepID=UPI002482B268|nr:beta-galactosidase [Flavobacterium eburneipallidum]